MPDGDAFGMPADPVDIEADYAIEEPEGPQGDAPPDPDAPTPLDVDEAELEAAADDAEPDTGDPLARSTVPGAPPLERPATPAGEPAAAPRPDPGTAAGEPAESAEPRYAGRFTSDRDLEQGYLHVRALHERTAAELNQTEQENQQLRQLLTQAAQQLQTRQAPEQPAAPEQIQIDPRIVAAAENAGLDQEAVRLVAFLASQEAERRVGQVRSEIAAAQQAQQAQQAQAAQQTEHQEALRTVAEWRSRHPEVGMGTQLDQQMAEIVEVLQLDPADPEMLDVALEAAGNPALYGVLVADPDYTLSEQGMNLARTLATLNVGGIPAAQAGQANGAPAPRPPHVERGGQGAPPSPGGTTASDDPIWGPVLDLARADRAKSAFGV